MLREMPGCGMSLTITGGFQAALLSTLLVQEPRSELAREEALGEHLQETFQAGLRCRLACAVLLHHRSLESVAILSRMAFSIRFSNFLDRLEAREC